MKYNHRKIEAKWQKEWTKNGLYKTEESTKKPKCYVLDMFPYPSGEGLHVGHPKGYIATDIYSRYKKMKGFAILHPMGWDAFGLPAENFAIKNKIHPQISVKKNIKRFKEQLLVLGFNYDWGREINTTDPEYYKWTQWIFLKLFEKGLAYESHEPINWCPSCQTGLANEDVEGGRCERCGTIIEKRPMRQWVLRITQYADRMLKDLEGLHWPESIKESQRNWIGKSEGAEIEFKIVCRPTNPTPAPLPQGEGKFGYQTTDPKTWKMLQEQVLKMRQNPTKAENLLWQELRDNAMGCHFRRQHIIGKFIVDFVCLEKQLVIEVDGDIHDYQKEADAERTAFLKSDGFKVIRFRNDEVTNDMESVKIKLGKVLKTLPFGEGLGGVNIFTTRPDTLFGATYMVLAPEHPLVHALEDTIENLAEVKKYIKQTQEKPEVERTAEGKEKTGVELKGVKAINPANNEEIPVFIADYVLAHYGTGAIMAVPHHDDRDRAFAEKFNLPIVDRPLINKKEIVEKVSGTMTVTYKLRDWVFSRQRYWGEPIPIIHCVTCGVVPVSEKDLPIKLPEVKSYEPTGTGESPLANITKWVNVACPKCGGKGKRETNTMPQWAGSSWYYLRYIDPHNKKVLVDPKKEQYWSPVDLYVGGAEHATRHLIYARFWHKFLYDIGVVHYQEPFMRLQHVGLIMDEDGRKMSKRYGNVINPDDVVEKVGADTLRLYEMFMGPFDQSVAWSTDGILGPRRFLDRVWKLGLKLLDENSRRGRAVPTSDFIFKIGRRDGVKEFSDNSLQDQFERLLHKTIKKVTEDIEAFHFNTAISQLMILLNEMEKIETLPASVFQLFLKLLAPFAPHIADELWSRFFVTKKSKIRDLHSKSGSIHTEEWPKYDSTLVQDETFELIIQINGKMRDKVEAPIGITQQEAEALTFAREKVKNIIGTDKPRKVIFVPKRLINIVL